MRVAIEMPDSVGAILVAAGRSTRMGFDKVWAKLGDGYVLAWSLHALAESGRVDRLALVVAPGRVLAARDLAGQVSLPVAIVEGGERRRDSVARGLEALDDCDWIVVHDAARPLLSASLVSAGLAAARSTGAAVAALPVSDTIKRVRDLAVVETLARAELWAVQTPEVFRRDLLSAALRASDDDVTDEATLLEAQGAEVRVFGGEHTNLKITTPDDLELARALVQLRATGLTS